MFAFFTQLVRLIVSPFQFTASFAVLLFALMLTIPVATVQAQVTEILRVDIENGTTTDDGSAWGEDAIQYLQDALARAEVLFGPPFNVDRVDIWVAQGEYETGSSPFMIPSNVRLFGGFNGDETLFSQRPLDPSTTVLTGSNPYNLVVTFIVTDNTARLDGFTIDGATTEDGILLSKSDAIISNCIIRNCTTGAFAFQPHTPTGPSSKPQFINCRFTENRFQCILASDGVVLRVVNCLMHDNGNEGANSILHIGGSGDPAVANIFNTTIANNVLGDAALEAAIRVNRNGTLLLKNSILWGNETFTGLMDESVQIHVDAQATAVDVEHSCMSHQNNRVSGWHSSECERDEPLKQRKRQ